MNEKGNFETSPGEVRKKFQVTNFTMPNNRCFMEYALNSVPSLADVGVLHGDGDGDGPVTPAPGSGSKKHTHHVDQHEKLVQKSPFNPS